MNNKLEIVIQRIADKYYWDIKRSRHLTELKDALREAICEGSRITMQQAGKEVKRLTTSYREENG